MVLVKSVEVDIGVKGDRESKAKLDDITKRAEALKKAFPEYKLKIDSAAAAERLKVFRAQLADATRTRTAEVKVKVDDSALAKFAARMKSGGGPAWLGPALALAPAAASLAGVGAGAAAGLGGAFIAGAGALAAFGAVTKPVLSDAKKAAGAVAKAQDNYNIAIANGTKQATAYKAEQVAIAKAYAGMSPAQIALSRQLGTMAGAWDKVKAAQTPVIAGALQPWLKSVTGLTASLPPIIAKVAPVIRSLGAQFGDLVNSSAFKGFRDFIGSTGAAALSAGGSTIIDLVKSFMILLPKFDPLIREAVGWIGRLGPAVLTWASSKKASDDITRFMQWFSKNGPVVGQLLRNIGGALKAMAPGLTTGGMLELQALSGFLGFVAKLPPGIAKPLFSVAGALLLLNKVGVVTAGVKLVGLGTAASGAGAAGGPLAAAGAGIAGGLILKIRQDLKSGWQGIAHDLPQWLSGVGGVLNLSAQGWANAITDKFSRPVRRMWDNLGRFLAASFDQTRHDVAHVADNLSRYLADSFGKTRRQATGIWNDMWLNTITRTARGFHDVAGWFDRGRHDIAAALALVRAGAAQAWDQVWNNTVSRTARGIRDVMGWIGTLPGRVTGVFRGAGRWLLQAGHDVLQGFWNGLTAIWGKVMSWISGIASWIKAHKGPVSLDASLLYPAGHAMMSGLLSGLKAGFGPVGSFVGGLASFVGGKISAAGGKLAGGIVSVISSLVNAPGSGVSRWIPLIVQALRMEHLDTSLLPLVMRQMQSESGGNPNAINLTDINAQMGTPSKGLMQVIGPTFAYWHWPGTSWNIYDPLANIAAALNYAAHGKGFGTGRGQLGSMHGYALGTSFAAPGWAWVGERGPELMRFRGGEQVAPVHAGPGGRGGGPVIVIEQLIVNAPVGSNPRDIGRQLADYLGAHVKGGGRIYPAGVTPR